MAVFSLATAAVKTAYDAYLTASAAVVATQASITGLGAQPTPPVDVEANADWNDYVTALDAWNASYAGFVATLLTQQATLRAAELAIYTAIGYGTGNDANSIVLNQWIKVVGAGAGILTYTKYIAGGMFFPNTIKLIVKSTLPTQAYPNF